MFTRAPATSLPGQEALHLGEEGAGVERTEGVAHTVKLLIAGLDTVLQSCVQQLLLPAIDII